MRDIIGLLFQVNTRSAWGDWALHAASPLRALAWQPSPRCRLRLGSILGGFGLLLLLIVIHAVGFLHVFAGIEDFYVFGYFYVRLCWTGSLCSTLPCRLPVGGPLVDITATGGSGLPSAVVIRIGHRLPVGGPLVGTTARRG